MSLHFDYLGAFIHLEFILIHCESWIASILSLKMALYMIWSFRGGETGWFKLIFTKIPVQFFMSKTGFITDNKCLLNFKKVNMF